MWFLVINNGEKIAINSLGQLLKVNNNTRCIVDVLFYHAHHSPFDLHFIHSTNDCWRSTPQRRWYNVCLKPKTTAAGSDVYNKTK